MAIRHVCNYCNEDMERITGQTFFRFKSGVPTENVGGLRRVVAVTVHPSDAYTGEAAKDDRICATCAAKAVLECAREIQEEQEKSWDLPRCVYCSKTAIPGTFNGHRFRLCFAQDPRNATIDVLALNQQPGERVCSECAERIILELADHIRSGNL